MNKEIKEILFKLRCKKRRYEFCVKADISFSDDSYEACLLLNYIDVIQQKLITKDASIATALNYIDKLGLYDKMSLDLKKILEIGLK